MSFSYPRVPATGPIAILILALGACGGSRSAGQAPPPAPPGTQAGADPAGPDPGATPGASPEATPATTVTPAEIAAVVAKLRFRVSKQATLLAVAGARVAALPVDNVFELAPARWSPDRSEVVVQYDDYCHQTHRVTFSARTLVAHLENADALAEYRAGRPARAAVGFARAVALDPDFDLAYTNQAQALAVAGDAAAAVAALQPLLDRNPVHVYARVMLEPGLAALREQPAIAAVRSHTPGTATIDATTFTLAGARVAIDGGQAGGRIAAIDVEASWGTCRFESKLQIFDAATGALRAEVPIVTWADADPDACDGQGLLPEARTRVAARVEAANRVLRDLGFAPVTGTRPSAGSEEAQGDRVVIAVPFPADRLTLEISDGIARVTRAAAPARGARPAPARAAKPAPGQVLVERPVPPATAVTWALHVPAAGAVIYAWQRPGAEGCEGSDPTGVVVLPLSSAPTDTPATP